MTDITRLTDANANERPELSRVYVVRNEAEEAKALDLYTTRYDRVPERVFVWRGIMYVEVER